MIKIRKATETDKEKIYSLRYSVYVDEFSVLNENELKQEFDEFDEISYHYIAENKGEIVGCLRIIPSSNKKFPFNKYVNSKIDKSSIEISRVILKKEYRKRNFLFVKLFIFAINDMLASMDIKTILVDTIIKNNFIGCQQIIKKFNYKPISDVFFDKKFGFPSQIYAYNIINNEYNKKFYRLKSRMG
jgi:N-acyl-L-homoserine lactone synthetase